MTYLALSLLAAIGFVVIVASILRRDVERQKPIVDAGSDTNPVVSPEIPSEDTQPIQCLPGYEHLWSDAPVGERECFYCFLVERLRTSTGENNV